VSCLLRAPAALPLGKEPIVPLDRRLGGLQNLSGRYGEVKILDPAGTRTGARGSVVVKELRCKPEDREFEIR
jgi:hypothetical protein